ncbi:hypothetical protein M3O75_03880 [Klebsiella pneumoniae]|nr:hypothetical protein [Klebsiella pneumoniae]
MLNVKVFDYQLDIDGVQAVTHTSPPARSTISSWRCSRMRPAGCRWKSSPTRPGTTKPSSVATWRD